MNACGIKLNPRCLKVSQVTHPAPCLDALVYKVREGLPGDVAAGAFGDVERAILQDDLALADDYQWGATALHAFKDVVLKSLGVEEDGYHQSKPCPCPWPELNQTVEAYWYTPEMSLSPLATLGTLIFCQ